MNLLKLNNHIRTLSRLILATLKVYNDWWVFQMLINNSSIKTVNCNYFKCIRTSQGLMYHYLNNQRLAEKILRYAAKLDPWSSETW